VVLPDDRPLAGLENLIEELPHMLVAGTTGSGNTFDDWTARDVAHIIVSPKKHTCHLIVTHKS
jgi:hypothetical protein